MKVKNDDDLTETDDENDDQTHFSQCAYVGKKCF